MLELPSIYEVCMSSGNIIQCRVKFSNIVKGNKFFTVPAYADDLWEQTLMFNPEIEFLNYMLCESE